TGLVAVLGAGVVTWAADDRGEFLDVQEVHKAAEGDGSEWSLSGRPWVRSGRAGVGGGGPVGVQGGYAPAGDGVRRGGGDQVASVGVVQDPEPGDLAGRAGIPAQGGVGHGDGDQRADTGTARARRGPGSGVRGARSRAARAARVRVGTTGI